MLYDGQQPGGVPVFGGDLMDFGINDWVVREGAVAHMAIYAN